MFAVLLFVLSMVFCGDRSIVGYLTNEKEVKSLIFYLKECRPVKGYFDYAYNFGGGVVIDFREPFNSLLLLNQAPDDYYFAMFSSDDCDPGSAYEQTSCSVDKGVGPLCTTDDYAGWANTTG